MSKKAVIGIVPTRSEAEAVVERLRAEGFSSDDISALLPDTRGTRDFAHEQNTKAPEGAVTGASAGGILGGTLGVLAGIGALAIPGVGPLIAAGPILAALSGAAAGAAVGGIGGALVGMGIPEVEAKQYEGKVKDGNILISVHIEDDDQKARAKKILENAGATNIGTLAEASAPKAKVAHP